MKTLNVLLIMCAGAAAAAAAAGKDTMTPCASPECKQFDFWIGQWNLTWTSKEGQRESGTNRVSKILNGYVIKEEFSDSADDPTGISLSTFVPAAKQWKQTWVDNSGDYLDFTGGFTNDRMILQRTAQRDGREFLQRMQWYNIGPHSLDWTWERSDDDGATWAVLWRIHYERKL